MLSAGAEVVKAFAQPAVSLLIAILGAIVGYKFALRRFRKERRLDFVRDQVTLLYSPLVGCIKRIRASSELRVELSGACDTAWRRICDENAKPFLDHEKHFEPFKRQIEDENARFPKYLLPLYDQMVDTFTKHYWLAEPSTRVHYKPFCRFVELWHRNLDDAIPPRVLEELHIEEAPLVPFYDDIESHQNRLRDELSINDERRTTPSTRAQ